MNIVLNFVKELIFWMYVLVNSYERTNTIRSKTKYRTIFKKQPIMLLDALNLAFCTSLKSILYCCSHCNDICYMCSRSITIGMLMDFYLLKTTTVLIGKKRLMQET